MNIYSIEEIVKATNNFFDSEAKKKIKKTVKEPKGKIPVDIENIISEAENALILNKKNKQNLKLPLILKNEIFDTNKLNLPNYKIKLKPKVKNHMVNELYVFFKKRIRKNTLQLIIDQQVEIKNLKNKINFLKQNEDKLKTNYQKLKDNHEILKINNNSLQNYLAQVNKNKERLDIENKELKLNLKKIELNLEEFIQKNRSFEVNNSELKNTISRYIVNYKKLQEETNQLTNSNKLKSVDENKKIEFYQNENVRLSSELLSARKKNETIKENLNNIELEKEKISNKINELNNSIVGKSNIVPSSFIKEIPPEAKKDIAKLTDKEEKNLDEVINRIFTKI